jgi:AcrR family transcriptional regulator
MRNARSDAMFGAIRRAFMERGYLQITMGELAAECGLTRRALYHHFSSKEEAFRAQLVWRQMREMDDAVAAASHVLCEGGSGIDAVVKAVDAGFGCTQRELATSPKAAEFGNMVSRCCSDLVFEAAENFRARLANLLRELEERGMIFLKRDLSADIVAEMLICAARGVNAGLPAYPVGELESRYQRMCESILFGCASRALANGAVLGSQAMGLAAE